MERLFEPAAINLIILFIGKHKLASLCSRYSCGTIKATNYYCICLISGKSKSYDDDGIMTNHPYEKGNTAVIDSSGDMRCMVYYTEDPDYITHNGSISHSSCSLDSHNYYWVDYTVTDVG